MIGLVTDSASMLPDELRDRHGVRVVPITIGVDGVDHLEGVDLDTADFYRRLADGASVTTAAPAPGAFVDTYRTAAALGAQHVLSIHTGSAYSATVASATVAANMVDVPVDVVDTGVASFPVALAVWAAAGVLDAHGDVATAARAATDTARSAGSLFVVGVPEVARTGGRFTGIGQDLTAYTVLELRSGELAVHAEAPDLEAAIESMAERARHVATTRQIRVGVGHAMRPALATELVRQLDGCEGIAEILIYEVGPSVGAHTGPGTVGVVYAPVPT